MNTEDSEFERIEREIKTRALPDFIHHTDTRESLEYITGWNDCRQAMLAEQPDIIGEAQNKLIAEQAAQKRPQNCGTDHCSCIECVMEPAQQEPVAWAMYQKGRLLSFWIEKGDAYDFEFTSEHSWVPLYTTPQAQPAREPLTDEQMAKAWSVADGEHNASASVKRRITRAIEAAHGIKEQP